MLRLLLAVICTAIPVAANAVVCRAPTVLLRITLEDGVCRVNDDVAIRREGADSIECLLSDPQLRVITLYPDGRFSYRDTDTDAFREGICTPD
jgi:hypothetical protein